MIVDPLKTQVALGAGGQPARSGRQIVELSLGTWGECAPRIGYLNVCISATRILKRGGKERMRE